MKGYKKGTGITDAQVEIEIERLKQSEAVRLAKAEQRELYRRRQYLYTLRGLERRGKQLMAEGMTLEDFGGEEDYEGA